MKPITIFCLHGVRTGGPEALHQLSDALIEQGFDARILYYTWEEIAALERAGAQDGYRFGGPRAHGIADYDGYKGSPVCEALNAPGHIIVLPETLCHLAPKFDRATVLIWWLSVDNAFGSLAKVNLNHLRRPSVRHAVQSLYAFQFLKGAGFREPAFLSDYSTDMRALLTCPLSLCEDREPVVVFNANHKVRADLDAIEARVLRDRPDARFVRLGHGMARADIATLLAAASVYVDLGCFPGKDRLPREAAQLGCSIVVAGMGAGQEFQKNGAIVVNPESSALVIIDLLTEPRMAGCAPEIERRTFFREVHSLFTELTGGTHAH